MKLHSFQDLVGRIAHLSTRDRKPVPITWGGGDAYTDGKRINLPALAAGTVLTPHQYTVWMGYILHEGPGHLTHTDFPEYTAAIAAHGHNPLYKYILNLIEDIRIENADIRTFPGDRKHLDSVHQYVDDKIPTDKRTNPGINGLIYKEGYTKYRNLNTGRIEGELSTDHPLIAKEMEGIPNLRRTQDCASMADRIFELIQEEQEQKEQEEQEQEQEPRGNPGNQPQGNQPQPGEKCDDGEQGPGGGQQEQDQSEQEKDEGDEPQSGGSSSRDNDEPLSSEDEGSVGDNDDNGMEEDDEIRDGDGDDTQGDDDNEGEEEGSGNDGDRDNPSEGNATDPAEPDPELTAEEWDNLTEIGNTLKDLLQSINKTNDPNPHKSPEHRGDAIFPPADISQDEIFVPSDENMGQYQQTRAQMAPQILALKKMFRIHLQARSKKSWLRGMENGQLDRQRLHMAPTGSKSLFKEKRDRTIIDTAVELMLDLSGSMDEEMVRAAAITLSEALSSIPQLKLSISGFTTVNKRRAGGRGFLRPATFQSGVGRTEAMRISVFKDYTEPYTKARGKLGAIRTWLSTPLGDAYGKALERLIPRKEPRKIIFLVTDGAPSFYKADPRHNDYLLMEKIHEKAKRLGIETIGLGIGHYVLTGFLAKYVDKCAHIEDIGNLPQTLMSVLRGVIR